MDFINKNPEGLHDDYVAGKFILYSLMFVSGGFRTQCFLQASSPDQYEDLRFGRNDMVNGATGISIHQVLSEVVDPDRVLINPNNSVDRLLRTSTEANELIFGAHQVIYPWFKANPDRAHAALHQDEEPVQAMLVCQEAGLALAASHILVAASLRDGDLTAVPFLQPKSITDASRTPLYPFAPNFVGYLTETPGDVPHTDA